MKELSVDIENPMPGGNAKTSLKRAKKFERTGRAVFTGPTTIRFLDGAARAALKERVAHAQHMRLTGCGYDRINGQWVACARHIPVIHPEKML